MSLERVCNYLKDAKTYYLATVENNEPRVRPFGTAHIFEGKLYIQTGKGKAVFNQIMENPNVEICAYKDGTWLRVRGKLVDDNRVEAKVSLLEAYPTLKEMYDAEDDNTRVLYLEDATATFYSFVGAPETVTF